MKELVFESLIPLLEKEDTWILLDSARCSPENCFSYLFLRPRRILLAARYDSVHPVLKEAEQWAARGFWVAGTLSYEAGYTLDESLLRTAPQNPGGPLVWLGVFDKPYCFNHKTGPTYPAPCTADPP